MRGQVQGDDSAETEKLVVDLRATIDQSPGPSGGCGRIGGAARIDLSSGREVWWVCENVSTSDCVYVFTYVETLQRQAQDSLDSRGLRRKITGFWHGLR